MLDLKRLKRIASYKYRLDPRRYIYFDSHDYRKTVFIAGCARSGTTWLQDIINYKNEYRSIFEPFHSEKISKVGHFEFRQYLRPQNTDPRYLEPAREILSGKVRHSYVDNFNKRLFSDKRLIKDVRANLFLKWIKVHFPEIPIIYIIRHPCAVSVSRRERGFDKHLDVFLRQKELMDDYLNPFRKQLENVSSMFDAYIYMWCVENYVPLQQFRVNEIHIVSYEQLCIRPMDEIAAIFKFINKPFHEDDLRLRKTIQTPSKLAREGSSILNNSNLINSWKNNITSSELSKAISILKEFNLDKIYSQDALPIVNKSQEFLSAISKVS